MEAASSRKLRAVRAAAVRDSGCEGRVRYTAQEQRGVLAEAAVSASGRGCCSGLIRWFGRCMQQELGTVAACLGVACSSSAGQWRGSVILRQAAGVARDADGGRRETEAEGISFRWWLREQLQRLAGGAGCSGSPEQSQLEQRETRARPLEQPGTQVHAGTATSLLELRTVASLLEQHGEEDSGAARGAGSGRGFSPKRWLRVVLESHAASVACSSGSAAAGAG